MKRPSLTSANQIRASEYQLIVESRARPTSTRTRTRHSHPRLGAYTGGVTASANARALVKQLGSESPKTCNSLLEKGNVFCSATNHRNVFLIKANENTEILESQLPVGFQQDRTESAGLPDLRARCKHRTQDAAP